MARLNARVQDGVVSPPAENPWLRFPLFPAGVAVLAFSVYVPTLSASWTSTDDTELIVDDAAFLTSDGAVRSAFGRPFFAQAARRDYYRPLVTASFVMDTPRNGTPTPEPYHLTNAILHAVTSALAFFFARSVGLTPLVAAGAGALVALHPVTAQTVAWIPGRCDGLMALFALGSLIAWIAFDRGASRRAAAAHHVLFLAALFSKETALAVPFVSLAYSVVVTRNRRAPRDPASWAGWAVAGAVWFFVRKGAVGAFDSTGTLKTMFDNFAALPIGFGKLVVPVELDVLATLRDSSRLPGVLAVSALGVAAVTIDPARRRLFVWAALLFPGAFLVPALAVSDFLILDNRLYLPLVGVAVGAAVAAESWILRSSRVKRPLAAASVVAGIVLARSTLGHAESFASPRAFCEAAVLGSPHLALAHLNLGAVEYRDGHFEDAKREFERAVSEDPNALVAHNDLGLIFMNEGDLSRAESEFTLELKANPNYSKAHYNLGLVLERTGRLELAREHFERVVALAPGDIDAWGELLRYWGPRDSARADAITKRMEALGVRFFSPEETDAPSSPR